MELPKDFRELLGLFNSHKVEYIVVGGYALAFHGSPRYTGDIDLFVKPDPHNAKKILDALKDFGFSSSKLAPEDFSEPDKVVQLGAPPLRVDIISSISGVTWPEAEKNKVSADFNGLHINFIGRKDFINNKKATARHKDLADVEAIEKPASVRRKIKTGQKK